MMPFHERRAVPRVRSYLPVRLYQLGKPVLETLSKDIGGGGIRCVSSTLIPVGSEIRLEVPLPNGEPILNLRGKAAWFRILPESDQFEVGISFLDVTDRTKRLLSRYFESIQSVSHV